MILKGKKLLLVEDEPMLRQVAREEFEYLGAEVVEAENGKMAFEIFRVENFDAIITDVRMPIATGIDLLDNIRTLDSKRPVVVLITGFSDLSVPEVYQHGASAVFSKPFDVEVVAQAVSKLLKAAVQRWTPQDAGLEAPFQVAQQFSDLESAIQSKALNIGQAGLFIASQGELPKMADVVHFEIEFQDSKEVLQGKGQVRWVRKHDSTEGVRGYGIEFLELDPASLKIVDAHLSKFATKAHIPQN